MPPFENQPDDIRFDRLTDGELSPDEYQQLLGTLDDEPGGWKRSALAFLEAQAWRGDFSALQQEPEQPAATPAPKMAQTMRSQFRYPLMMLAMAASFLVAFGLGLAARTNWMASTMPQTNGMLAADDAGAKSKRENARENQLAGDDSTTPLGNVQLVLEGDGQGSPERQVDLPVYHIRSGGADYLSGDISALPPEVQRMMEEKGLRLHRERTFLPFQLEGGRQVVVPVEEIEILPEPPL